MKYWFFAALFANFLLLLWEFHNGAFDSGNELTNAQKQILLLSEAPQSERLAATNAAALPEAGQQPSATLAASDTASTDSTIISPTTTPAAVAETAPPLPQTYNATAVVMPATITPRSEVATAPSVPVAPTTTGAVPQQTANADTVVQMPPTTLAVTTAPKPDAVLPTAPQEQHAVLPVPTDAPQQEAVAASASSAEPPPESVPQPQPETAADVTASPSAETTTAAVELPPAAPPKPEKTHQVCYRVTQVKDPSDLNALLDKYRPQLLALESLSREARKNDTYLVYYPPQATLQESIAFAENLRSNYGIQDLMVFREGELKGAVSLGIFSNEQRAKTAQSQFEQKGLQVQIRPRYQPEVQYSLKVRWKDGQAESADNFSKALKGRFAPVGRLASCPN